MAQLLKDTFTDAMRVFEDMKGTVVEGQMRKVVTHLFHEIVQTPKRAEAIRRNRLLVNAKEINEGRFTGKIAAIKMYRERTGQGLMESKLAVEKCFSDKGYNFYQY